MINLPLNALRVFEAAARLDSFSAAAQELCVTQSAVSHQIKHLESWLGVRLFARQGHSAELLPAGQDLAKTLTGSLGSISQACERVKTSGTNQPLVIAAIPSIATIWLVPRLESFRRKHPDIDVRIEYALHGRSINFNDVDFAFTYSDSEPVETNAKASVYLSGKACPVCRPAPDVVSDDKESVPETIKELGILHDTDTSAWQSWFHRARLPEPPLDTFPVFHDFNLLRAAALAGQGIALCPETIVQQDIESGRLVRLSDVTVQEEFNYYLTRSTVRRSSQDPVPDHFEKWVYSLRETPGDTG